MFGYGIEKQSVSTEEMIKGRSYMGHCEVILSWKLRNGKEERKGRGQSKEEERKGRKGRT